MMLSNTFVTLSIGLVAAGPLAIRNPQNSGIPFGANGLLGRAGANASPQAPQKPSTELQPLNCGAGKVLLDGESVNQSQSPELSCDCSKPFRSPGYGDACDNGYENTSFFFGAGKDCTQLNCAEEEFNTQCDAKLQDAKPAAVAESPTPIAANEKKTCDCYKPFQVPAFDGGSCRAGYEDIAFISIPECVQIGCSAQDYKAQCDAKP
ncbi:hypothetical protein ACQRIU_003518 [Beauveria bassiana]